MARKVYIQQSRKGGLTALIILVLVLVILGLTNPTKDDLANYLSSQARTHVTGKGPIADAFRGLAGGVASGISGFTYTRQNYIIFSLFNLGEKIEYVGFGKFIFIKTAK